MPLPEPSPHPSLSSILSPSIPAALRGRAGVVGQTTAVAAAAAASATLPSESDTGVSGNGKRKHTMKAPPLSSAKKRRTGGAVTLMGNEAESCISHLADVRSSFLEKEAICRESDYIRREAMDLLTEASLVVEAANAEARMKKLQAEAEYLAAKQRRVKQYLDLRKENPDWLGEIVLTVFPEFKDMVDLFKNVEAAKKKDNDDSSRSD